MRLHQRIAVLLLAAAFAAAPSLAFAAAACQPCCCPPPCQQAESGCEASLSSVSCCEEAPAAVPSVAKQSFEAKSLHAIPPSHAAHPGDGLRVRPPARGGDLPRLVSPLRLSVVLII